MEHLSANARREIIDWIVFGLSGETLYGDARDISPTDCDEFFIEQWNGRQYEAKLRRAHLERMSDAELRTETLMYGRILQRLAALTPRKRGRPKGAGSLLSSDQPLLDEVRQLIAKGLSPHAATQVVAPRARGGGTIMSKARRLARRLEKK